MNGKQIIEKDGVQYEVVRVVPKQADVKRVFVNGWDVTKYEKWYDEKYCLEAVKQDSDALQYVKEQTETICLEAVKQDGYALQYVKEQTETICLEAVKQNGDALQYVNKCVFLEG